jgi:hypothetical protein
MFGGWGVHCLSGRITILSVHTTVVPEWKIRIVDQNWDGSSEREFGFPTSV